MDDTQLVSSAFLLVLGKHDPTAMPLFHAACRVCSSAHVMPLGLLLECCDANNRRSPAVQVVCQRVVHDQAMAADVHASVDRNKGECV
jgi:hypothetical protein